MYQFTEREFLEFDKVVPMRFNSAMNVVSPKLYFLLMTICGQIESTVIHICKNLDMYKKNENFGTCYKKLLKESDVIERQSVEIPATRQIIKPFVKTNTDTPSWWTFVQQGKTHDSKRHRAFYCKKHCPCIGRIIPADDFS